ncbi:head-tail connector protein [Salibacterium lacus]|uniref:Head-tail connector protein n=1 Tax=Salibacterium lacus TaxID=1898109 RepID=A0ABW5T0E2_9BACI
MPLLEEVKAALRITTNDEGIKGEVQELINSAKIDLVQAGVKESLVNMDEPDAIIKRAIKTYAKANFGYDNPEAGRFYESYVMLKQHLSLYGDYKAAGS